MNYTNVQKLLADYDQAQVSVFTAYLKKLETEKDRNKQLKNKWFGYFKDEQAVDLYKKVALDNLFIDGDTITLQFKGAVIVVYDYNAYKNKLLNVYPESLFDIQNVYDNDQFSFKKENGRVAYTHQFGNPFDTTRKIVGCYCIIKNNRGEFIETLNLDDIEKMKAAAKTQKIWEQWYGEMVLKSVIKRACKRHFKDVVHNIEKLDNENYDLETIDLGANMKKEIEDCDTLEKLETYYHDNKGEVKDHVAFIKLIAERKTELTKNLTVDQNEGS